jgi:hypothetical protein
MRGIHFGSQITHLEESTKTNHPLNRTLVSLLMKTRILLSLFRNPDLHMTWNEGPDSPSTRKVEQVGAQARFYSTIPSPPQGSSRKLNNIAINRLKMKINSRKYSLLPAIFIASLCPSPATQFPSPADKSRDTGIKAFASNRIPPCTHSASGSGQTKGEAYCEAMGKAPSGVWTLAKVSYQRLGLDKWLCTITWANR